MRFDYGLDELKEELMKKKPKKVLVQLPEGMKGNAPELGSFFHNLSIQAIFSGDTCWGACAPATIEAKQLGADLIVHFGHAPFMKAGFPIIYVEVKDNTPLLPLVKKSCASLRSHKTLGLSFAVQHRHLIPDIIKAYQYNGFTIMQSKKKGHAAYEGHVVGCEYAGLKAIQNEVDAFVVIGNRFHGIGAAIAVAKPVFLIDVYNQHITYLSAERDLIIKQRAVAIDRLKHAKTVGIIIGTKQGQSFGTPNRIMTLCKKNNKEAVLITMDEFSPDKLTNFSGINCFIELACPRIAIDDIKRYGKTVLTYNEALVALGEKSWTSFLNEGIL
ncbi:MAG: diphthamide biosynthesis enzyme Dph2 [Nanoarchaeota archaeon]